MVTRSPWARRAVTRESAGLASKSTTRSPRASNRSARALPMRPVPPCMRVVTGRGAPRSPRHEVLLDPASAAARLDLDEAVLLLAHEDELFAPLQHGHRIGLVGRPRVKAHIGDLRAQHVAILEDVAGLCQRRCL